MEKDKLLTETKGSGSVKSESIRDKTQVRLISSYDENKITLITLLIYIIHENKSVTLHRKISRSTLRTGKRKTTKEIEK